MITVRVKLSRTQEDTVDNIAYKYDAIKKKRISFFANGFTEVDFIYLEYDFEIVELANKFLSSFQEYMNEQG